MPPPVIRRLATVAAGLVTLGVAAAQDGSPSWFEVTEYHAVQNEAVLPQLETPQSTLEFFFDAIAAHEYERAAAALNLRLVDVEGAAAAAELARRLGYVINQEVWVDWDAVPDRPDGVREPGLLGGEAGAATQPRRGLRIGDVEIQGRIAPISLHRVKAAGRPAIWLFSAHTVDNVERMWAVHGPSALARAMPAWAQERGLGQLLIWQWIGLGVVLLLAPLFGFVVAGRVVRFIERRTGGEFSAIVARLRWPIGAVVMTGVLWGVIDGVLGLPSLVAVVVEPLALILFVAAFVWFAMRLVSFFVDRFLKRAARGESDEDAEPDRQLLTQLTVARHILFLVLALVGVAVVLLQLNSFRAVGVTLLSSAGAMAVILGIAGHAVLGNLIAGLHIAFAQPFRIGDSVFVEDNWGRIEDVSYVDVVVRTWDERRLVFPIRYFVDRWFENWSKTDEYLKKPIYLHVDYRADVERIRERFEEIVRADPDWHGERDDPEVLVVDLGEEAMKLRLTCAAKDPSAAWALVNRVREQLVRWLQAEADGAWLPRRRVLVSNHEAAGDRAAADRAADESSAG